MSGISKKRVPNIYVNNPQLIVIGEAPGEDEEWKGEPFVGQSGELLRNTLFSHGYNLHNVSFLNLCQYKPPNNSFNALHGTEQLSAGLKEVTNYLDTQPTTLIITLGNWPAHFICNLPQTGITSYRGYIFDTIAKSKALVTVHPAAVLRDGTLYPLFHLDIAKAFNYKPVDVNYNIRIITSDTEALIAREHLLAQPELFSDIETTKKNPAHIICAGFSDADDSAYIFNMQDPLQRSCVKDIYESQQVQFGFHNGIFDTLVLSINNINVRNYAIDTTVPMHVMEPELPRSLEALVANYTYMPYYKKAGRAALPADVKSWGAKFNYNAVAVYNGHDCIGTRLVWKGLKAELEAFPNGMMFFNYEMEDIQVARDISLVGLTVDIERRQAFLDSTILRWHKKQLLLNSIAGFYVNVASPRDVPKLLYDIYNLPPRTTKGKVVTDEDAIVSLLTFTKDKMVTSVKSDTRAKWEIKHIALKLILEIRGLRKLVSSYLACPISPDNRIRSTYKAIGPETGRWAAAKFVDKTGLNAQTFPRGTVRIDTDNSMALIKAAYMGDLPKDEEDSDDDES